MVLEPVCVEPVGEAGDGVQGDAAAARASAFGTRGTVRARFPATSGA
ncbi:MAG TPA: hypothetical protein VF158_08815 [Longimicrobiales bacterium]